MRPISSRYALLALSLVGALSSCEFLAERYPRALGGPEDRVECGHDSTYASSPIINDIKHVPEFHDCQRFIVRGRDRDLVYDSLHAIYASSTLDSLMARLGPPLAEPRTIRGESTAAPVLLAVNAGVPVVSSTFQRNHRIVAVALAFSGGGYAPLGLVRGLSCLYLGTFMIDGDTTTRWFARMESQGDTSATDCAKSTTSQLTAGKDLKVIRQQPDGFTEPNDYPAVARWDWDDARRQQYIGIKCGPAWCEVGDSTFRPSAALPVPDGASRDEARVRLIKGWYDQQYLAHWDKKQARLVPTRILGTIIAVPDLGDKSDTDFAGSYVDVARVILEGGDPQDNEAFAAYRQKFNFRMKTSEDPEATLSIRRGGPNQMWRARIPGPPGGGAAKFRNVMFRNVSAGFESGGFVVPAVARWRWMRRDEGTWTRCTSGCCEMSSY